MSPEELKLVEEFTAAVNSAHTSMFASHLQKQLKDLQSYVDNHSKELERLSNRKIDDIHNRFQTQIKAIENNYNGQLKLLEEKRIELEREFNSKLDNLLSIVSEPVKEAQKELDSVIGVLSETMIDTNNQNIKVLNECFNNQHSAILQQSADVKANINTTNQQSIDRLYLIESKLIQKFDYLDSRLSESLKILLNEQKKERLYLWAPLLVSVFLILLIVAYVNFHFLFK